MDIVMLVDSKEQHWFKRVQLGTNWGIEDIPTSFNVLEKCQILTRQDSKPTQHITSISSSQSMGSFMSL